tara:strand:+ start:103 stop:231 length:129 start_codon:yes stop_codon:yes gene_type:complete
MPVNENKNGIFSNSKPKKIPKFWYPLVAGIVGIWIIFSYFLM